jgi:hypothetical protein
MLVNKTDRHRLSADHKVQLVNLLKLHQQRNNMHKNFSNIEQVIKDVSTLILGTELINKDKYELCSKNRVDETEC